MNSSPSSPCLNLLAHKKIILALLIRIILICSACHFDFLSYYWYAHFLVYHQNTPLNIPGGLVYFWPMLYINAIWLFFARIFISSGQDIWPHNWFIDNNPHIVNIASWQGFLNQGHAGWILFLLKIPYLAAELAVIFLVAKMIGDDVARQKAVNFLLFNPVTLFLIYIFGANDIFIVFFIVLSLYLIKKGRLYWGMFILGFTFIKFYTSILLPVFLVLLPGSAIKRLKLAIAALFPVLAVFFAYFLFGKLGIVIKSIAQMPQEGYIFSLVLESRYLYDRLYPFVVACILFMLYLFYQGQRIKFTGSDLSKYSLAILLVFYALSFFHPQYFLIAVFLIALQVGYRRDLFILFFIQAACFLIYTLQWGSDLSWRLFMPINPRFFAYLKSPIDIINQFYPADRFIGIFRSIFTATSFWMVYLMLKGEDDLSGYPRI